MRQCTGTYGTQRVHSYGDIGHRHRYSFSFWVPWLSRLTCLASIDLGLVVTDCPGAGDEFALIYLHCQQHSILVIFHTYVLLPAWRTIGVNNPGNHIYIYLIITALGFLLKLYYLVICIINVSVIKVWLRTFLNQSHLLCCAFCTFKRGGSLGSNILTYIEFVHSVSLVDHLLSVVSEFLVESRVAVTVQNAGLT